MKRHERQRDKNGQAVKQRVKTRQVTWAGVALRLLVGLHGLHNVQLVLHNLADCGLLLHYLILGLDLIGHWLLVNLQVLTLLGLRKPALFWLGLRAGTWLDLVWVHLRLHLVATG